MKKLIYSLLLMFSFNVIAAPEIQQNHCSRWFSFLQPVCENFHKIWTEGNTELYVSGYAWHNRYTYTQDKIDSYNELAWGGGLGKGLFDEKGNWQGLYAFAFLDSHKEWEPVVGYSYLKVATINKDIKAGIGYAALITARKDILNYVPFPGVLPSASLFFGKATLSAIYIPGLNNNGNVLYMVAKYTF